MKRRYENVSVSSHPSCPLCTASCPLVFEAPTTWLVSALNTAWWFVFASSAAQSFGRVQCEVVTPYPPAQSPPCPRKRVERTVLDLLLIEFPEIMTNEVVERVCELPIKEVGGA